MKNKILSVILIIMMVIFAMTISTSALSLTATMTPSSTNVQEGSEFMVTVKVSNLDVGTNGIDHLEGYFKYDTEVFETISESSIEGLNGWTPTYDETTGKISLTKRTFVTSTQEVFQVSLKTKTDVTGKSGNISYSNIVASNSETEIQAANISTSINIGTGSENTNTTSNNTISNISVITPNTNTSTNTNVISVGSVSSNSVSNNTTNNTSNSSVSSYVNTVTNTTSNDDMPYTGVSDTVMKLMFAAIGIALVFYIKIEKINKDMK